MLPHKPRTRNKIKSKKVGIIQSVKKIVTKPTLQRPRLAFNELNAPQVVDAALLGGLFNLFLLIGRSSFGGGTFFPSLRDRKRELLLQPLHIF